MVLTIPDNINTIDNLDSVNENFGECEKVVKHYWWKNELHRPKRKMRQNNNLFICDKNIKISHIIFR